VLIAGRPAREPAIMDQAGKQCRRRGGTADAQCAVCEHFAARHAEVTGPVANTAHFDLKYLIRAAISSATMAITMIQTMAITIIMPPGMKSKHVMIFPFGCVAASADRRRG
jgi:hypothetical protein